MGDDTPPRVGEVVGDCPAANGSGGKRDSLRGREPGHQQEYRHEQPTTADASRGGGHDRDDDQYLDRGLGIKAAAGQCQYSHPACGRAARVMDLMNGRRLTSVTTSRATNGFSLLCPH